MLTANAKPLTAAVKGLAVQEAMQEVDHSAKSQTRQTSVLAYVHLRNIYASTGAGRTARQLVEALASRNDLSLRILADAADKARILPLVESPWTEFEYSVFASETSRQQARWFFLNSPKAEDYWPATDILFCTAESYVPTRKAPLVVTTHDAGYFETTAHRRDLQFWKTRAKWRLLFKKLSREVDIFHTVSSFSAERLAHFFPSISSRLRVVPNGVTAHFFEPVTRQGLDELERFGLAEQQYILIPGGLHFRKNAELILAASALLLRGFPNLVIAVVNHSDPRYGEAAARLGPRFRRLGFVSDDALRALYGAAALVWFPSRYEGFGLPVIEAMACGTPVVASNTASIPEIAGDAAMLKDPDDVNGHLDAISGLLTDSAARKQFSEWGMVRARSFTWDAAAALLKGEFDKLTRTSAR